MPPKEHENGTKSSYSWIYEENKATFIDKSFGLYYLLGQTRRDLGRDRTPGRALPPRMTGGS